MGELASVVLRQQIIDIGSLYREGGQKKSYNNLSPLRKDLVKSASQEMGKMAFSNLKNKKVSLKAGNETIEVGFTKKGTMHAVRDIMLTLSSENFSKNNILNLDGLLSRSKLDRIENDRKDRIDGKSLFYKYRDRTGKEVMFVVAYEKRKNSYYLYAVTQK